MWVVAILFKFLISKIVLLFRVKNIFGLWVVFIVEIRMYKAIKIATLLLLIIPYCESRSTPSKSTDPILHLQISRPKSTLHQLPEFDGDFTKLLHDRKQGHALKTDPKSNSVSYQSTNDSNEKKTDTMTHRFQATRKLFGASQKQFCDPTWHDAAYAKYLDCLKNATRITQVHLCVSFYNIGAFNNWILHIP